MNVANGWTAEISFSASTVSTGVTIFDIANTAGGDALTLKFESDGQLSFFHGINRISCGQVTVNTWTHVAVVIVEDGVTMEGQCYFNGERGENVQTFPRILPVTRNSALLGKSNTATNSNFNGQIDAFRILHYSLTSEDALELYATYSSEGRVIDPPKFSSGPLLAHSFDTAPLPQTDPPGSPTYNFYNWEYETTSYYRNTSFKGVAVFNGTGNSYALRQYLNLNFDQDSFGKTMPQTWSVLHQSSRF